MGTKKNQEIPISIRFGDMRPALEKEAQANGMKLSGYIKHLVHTHPKRTANKK